MKGRLLAAGAALGIVLAVLPDGPTVSAAIRAGAPAFTDTKTITRDNLVNGVTATLDSRTVTLSVDTTTNLRGFQQLEVLWSGAHPSGASVGDVNNGSIAADLQFPMVLLECRGIDSATAPPNQQLDPTTCWTAYEAYDRAAVQTAGAGQSGFPPWRVDLYAGPAQRAAIVGAPDPAAVLAGSTPPITAAQLLKPGCRDPVEYWVPFRASSGAVYYPNLSCQGFPDPPEAVPNGADPSARSFPSNETFGETGIDGAGRARFDVFTANENASLGCSETVPCALVAIPIMGTSCDIAAAGLPPEDQPSPTQTVNGTNVTVAQQAEADCTTPGDGTLGTRANLAVTGHLWWAESNWRNRITVPLSFAPVGDPCGVVGSNGELDIYGSELMTEATAQWDPHFCLDSSLFTLKHVQTPEPEARNILAQNKISAAFATYAPPDTYTKSVVSAPVAISGFAVAFTIDDNSGNEVTNLRLNARLLAKLLTESYPDVKDVKAGDPGLQNNPLNITQDPEFLALNPQVATGRSDSPLAINRAFGVNADSASTLYALSSDSDVMYALSSYIINDPEAKAWLNGAPDPWGMMVNPNFDLTQTNQLALPTNSWRLLDTFLSPVGNPLSQCPDGQKSPFLGFAASPVSKLFSIALGVEFSWPFSVICKRIDPTEITAGGYQLARANRTFPGNRFMLGLTSLPEAHRFSLRTASLQTQVATGTPQGQFAPPNQRTFVAPSDASVRAAAHLLTPDPATQTWQIPPEAIQSSAAGAGAYPGTMPVYAEVPTTGLSANEAGHIAQFLRFAAGPGQQPGTGVGQLPPGYLPMTTANGLGALAAYANIAADAVQGQTGTVPPIVPGGATPSDGSTGGGPSGLGSGPGSGSGSGSGGGKGSGTTSPASSQTATGTATGTAPGATSAIGPAISGFTRRQGGVPSPVAAPSGLPAVVGKTIAIVSAVAASFVRWLFYIALAALAAAAALYGSARRRGLTPSLAALQEWLSSVLRRRRAR